jgi:hypothetical protein
MLVAQGLKAKRAMRLAADVFFQQPQCDVQLVTVSALVFNKPKVLRDLVARIESKLVC